MLPRNRAVKWNPMKTKWDMFTFAVTYCVAAFYTCVGAAEACNTTTISVLETVTEVITLANSLPTTTVTLFSPGFNGTSGIFPDQSTNTLTVTEFITLTSGDIGSQSASVVSSDSTSTSTVTTLATSYVNHTVTSTLVSETAHGSGTRVSIPGSLTLTFPIVTASSPCVSNCSTNTGPPFPMSNITSTYTVTSTTHVTSNPDASMGGPPVILTKESQTITLETISPKFSVETSFPVSTPEVSSFVSVATAVNASTTSDVNTGNTTTTTTLTTVTATADSNTTSKVGTGSTTTVTTLTTTTATGDANITSAVKTGSTKTVTTLTTTTTTGSVSIISEANSGSTTTVTTLTTTTATGAPNGIVLSTITVLPVESVLSAATSILRGASSEIANSTTEVTTATRTITPIESILSEASSVFSAISSELTTVSSEASTTTVTVQTTTSETLAPSTVTAIAVNATLASAETDTSTLTGVLTLTSVVPMFLNSTSTVTLFSTIPVTASSDASTSTVSAFTSAVNTTSTATVLTNETTTIIVPTVATAGVRITTTASALSVSSIENSTSTFTITSQATVSLNQTNTITVSAPTSTSSAMSLYNSTLTGGASSLRVPRVFSIFAVLITLAKKTLVGAVNAGGPLPVSMSSDVPVFSVVGPVTSMPAQPAPVSTTTQTCTSNVTVSSWSTLFTAEVFNTTVTVDTTVLTYSTVFTTLTTSVPGALAPSNSSLNATGNNLTHTSGSLSAPLPFFSITMPTSSHNTSVPVITYTSPAFGQNVTSSQDATGSTTTKTTHAPKISTVNHTASTASPTSGVGRVEITGALLVMIGVVAWIVL